MKKKLFQQVVKLQNKDIRIINSLPFNINKKFLNCQILYRYKAVYLWKIALNGKSPAHLSTALKTQGLNILKEHVPYLKIVLLYQMLTQTFIKYQCIDTWNKYQKEFKIDLLNGRRPDVKKLLTESFLQSYLER